MAETAPKKQKLNGPLIGTHNGQFHADEALAVYMLRMLPTYASSPLVRTRDPAKLQECHTVVDVGGQYDASANRFDHHQRDFAAVFPGHTTKLSSAGLVYLHHGKRVIAHATGLDEAGGDAALVFEKLYADLIEAFDANDNGVSAYDPAALDAAAIPKRFNDRGFSLASVVARMNHPPPPADSSTAQEAQAEPSAEEAQAAEDARFEQASAFAGAQFRHELLSATRSWLPARAIVQHSFRARNQYDAAGGGRILVLPHRRDGLPWEDHLYALEQAEEPAPAPVLYVLFPESGEPDSRWRVRAVSKAKGAFELRRPLREEWRGLRDDELSRVSGVPGCVFVHASGFIGGNVSFDGALKMAQLALE